MLILISPAKTLDYQSPLATPRYTQPELLDHSQQLIQQARQLSAPQISRLMGISDKLADLNATRFHDWQPHFTPDNARQAILAFKGDVYTGLQAETFNDADFDFCSTTSAHALWLVWRIAPAGFNAALSSGDGGFAWRIRAAKIFINSGAISLPISSTKRLKRRAIGWW
ncbi:UPF0246 protein YaaA [Salmonella enterica subsp. enterica]|uniref:UPF0246 protein YaaA n=1 Tax=Salmonella enterica I TaxID=59201 RepID=A0A447TNA7_SALET|nr:UPF0246 protein YaaA [Salmonella enterica subsp. enterica]